MGKASKRERSQLRTTRKELEALQAAHQQAQRQARQTAQLNQQQLASLTAQNAALLRDFERVARTINQLTSSSIALDPSETVEDYVRWLPVRATRRQELIPETSYDFESAEARQRLIHLILYEDRVTDALRNAVHFKLKLQGENCVLAGIAVSEIALRSMRYREDFTRYLLEQMGAQLHAALLKEIKR